MKILHISYIETNEGWGAECFVDRALEMLGHTVYKLDFKRYEKHLLHKLGQFMDFDIVLLQRGDWFPKELLEAINRPKIFWASELISRCRDQDRLLYSRQFEHIFVHSKICKEMLSKKLLKKKDHTIVTSLLNAFDEKVHCKLGLEKSIEVLFIGSITKRRAVLLDKLRGKVDLTICENIFGKDFVEKVNRAKIVINIHASKRPDTETRVFEVLGCGSFLLTEPLAAENPFIHGKHYVEAEIEEFPSQIEKYLREDTLREHIAEQGYLEAVNRHSYFERTRNEIIPVLSKYTKSSKYTNLPIYNNKLLIKYRRKEASALYWSSKKIYIKIFGYYQRLYDWLNVK